MRVFAALLVIASAIALCACGGGTAVKSTDDAERAMKAILSGADSAEYHLAEGALPLTEAMFAEKASVMRLRQTLNPDDSTIDQQVLCDAVELSTQIGDLTDYYINLTTVDRFKINSEIARTHPEIEFPQAIDTTREVLDAVNGLTNNNVVVVLDLACSLT